jgi:hypothetical protein
MKKRKKSKPARNSAPPKATGLSFAADDQILASDLTLHELFQQQTAAMLERADLSDEQKQAIMIGMSCPCCGGGGFSFTAKLKPAK